MPRTRSNPVKAPSASASAPPAQPLIDLGACIDHLAKTGQLVRVHSAVDQWEGGSTELAARPDLWQRYLGV